MRFPQGGKFEPAVQNFGARISGGVPQKMTSGITADEYQLPAQVIIFPENLVPGNPPPKSNFGDILYLDNGMGQLPMVSDVFDSNQIQLGLQPAPFFPNQTMTQLNPFPDATLPPITCVPGTFSSVAVPKFNSNPNPPFAGVTVTLDGTASNPPSGPFAWTQVINPGDPIVTINNPTSATPTFIAPTVPIAQNLTFQLIVGGNGSSIPVSAPASLSVPIVIAPPNTPPSLSATASFAGPPAVSGNSISVPSDAAGVTLTATGVDPAGGTLTFTWSGPAGVVLTPASADGSVQTFTAPEVPELTQAQTLTFTVTGTSSAGGLTGTATVTVVVQPVVDKIVISNVVYRRTKGRLIINVSDFTPNVTLTATLDIINPATGQPWTGVMGPINPFSQGVFSIRFSNIPAPNLVTITSSAGGVATSGVTFLR